MGILPHQTTLHSGYRRAQLTDSYYELAGARKFCLFLRNTNGLIVRKMQKGYRRALLTKYVSLILGFSKQRNLRCKNSIGNVRHNQSPLSYRHTFRDLFNKRLHTLIVINKISVICLAIDHSASGVVIKINVVFEFVILLPNLVVTVRIVQKITARFSFIQRAAMK